MGGRVGVTGISTTAGVVGLRGAPGGGEVTRVVSAPAAGGPGHGLSCFHCPAPCAHRFGCIQEAGVVCASFPAATRFSEAAGSATVVRGLRPWALSPLAPWFSLLRAFQSTCLHIGRCVDLSGILVCWAEGPLLSSASSTDCRLKGRNKSFSCHMALTDISFFIVLMA